MSEDTPPDEPEAEPSKPPKLRMARKVMKRGHITREQYDILAEAYLKGGKRTIRALRAATGVAFDTASKAIAKGWPERGWPPLRDRAVMFDRQKREIEDSQLDKQAPMNRAFWLLIRAEHVNSLVNLRRLNELFTAKIVEALNRTTADRHGVRTWVHQEEVGKGKNKRIVHKVLKEDTIRPPYLPEVMYAFSAAANVAAQIAGEARSWIALKEPDETKKPVIPGGLPGATQEDIEYINSHNGELPPGKTLEDLISVRPA